MDLEHVQRLAQAFAQGVAFSRGFTEMAQDARDGEEEGRWVTIGGERGADGEKHGGRPVFISGSGTIKKGLSKSAQGKTLGQVFGKGGEFSSEGKKSKGETAREAGERTRVGKKAGERSESIKDRRDATSRAREFRQETKQIVTNDLEPSVAKLKKALDTNVPARVHDDLVDMHRLADQIGVMANKLCSLNSRWAENSKEPSAFVVSSHGQNAKGTAERVAKLARRSVAMARDFGKPRHERLYSDAQATSGIRDNLSELRGLHQDLLDHIRRIQEPEKREEPQEDPLYAARGKVINGSRAESKKAESKPAQQETETVKALKDAYNVSADQIDEMTPKQADRPFLNRLDRIHKDAVALAESAPEISNSHELREMTRIMKLADKLVKALPSYYDRNYYGGWVQNLMGKVRVAEEAYTKLKERKARGPNAAI